MPHFYVEMQVNFSGHVEAENKEEAEQIAYTGWGETSDALITYESVEEINVELDDDAWCEDHETYECICGDEEEDDEL